MKFKKTGLGLLVAIPLSVLIYSCTNDVKSSPNFIFKPAPDNSLALKIGDKTMTKDEVFSGIEGEIYQKEQELFELKMAKIKSLVLSELIRLDPSRGTMTDEEFLAKNVSSQISIKNEDVEAFANDKKIPKQHMTPEMKDRIKKFLEIDAQKIAVETWMGKKTANSPIEIFIAKPKRPVFNVSSEGAPFQGAVEAKVTLVEFSDFQCPFCAKGAEILANLKKKYGNKIKVVFKNFPLEFHKDARKAAEAGLCINDQNTKMFWSFHDYLFKNQDKLNDEGLAAGAKFVGANVDNFKKCLEERKFAQQVAKDIADGKNASVKSTPTFFVNGQLISGAMPLEIFSELIDEQLAM